MDNEVKLVLCDLDGTILDSDKKIPAQFYEVFQQLKQKGIAMGMATGRPVSNINVKFSEVKDELCNVAENGGCVTYKGELLHLEKLKKAACHKVINKTRTIEDCGAVLCALNATYIDNQNEDMVAACKEYYPDLKIVDDLLEVNDAIVKMSVYDLQNNSSRICRCLDNIDDSLEYATSSSRWVDLMNKGVSKAKGIEYLCEHMGITLDNVMAFGDEMNDYQMLSKVKHSYAMGNALEEIKAICRNVCESNDEDGVMKTLKNVFQLK